MHNCSNEFDSKISKPKISNTPNKDAPSGCPTIVTDVDKVEPRFGLLRLPLSSIDALPWDDVRKAEDRDVDLFWSGFF